jgi:putative phosphoribosyl transferase
MSNARERAIEIPLGDVTLHGDLAVPAEPRGLVLFAHGSGSSRRSPRNRYVAGVLQQAQIATLLFDLLTSAEEQVDAHTAELRFDIEMLASRLGQATDWVLGFPDFNPDGRVTPDDIRIGYFGASTGAAAALIAAASHPDIAAVVSRGGRTDLAGEALPRVTAPTLLIVGGDDDVVIGMNKTARAKMTAETRLEIVPGASHLFEEPGTLEEVARLARMWFEEHLGRKVASDYAA